ncbi:MAG TPA: 6-pyruvoyl tetrahydropterin synthase family protein [Ktedonobacteraceae bacterium]|jgi:6-pyruvoyltetrahydropterin/6-carboxytetrahydropterin synthase|nr:6-pyruvoyl tetrahydropterin synthase family protein [Ktedonobacteraceae bacterium]
MSGKRITRRVKVEGGYLKFSAAHFITYSGTCERLHGHNYKVLVEMEGELGEDKLVFDFTVLKRLTREICQRLDHRFLLPMHNPHFELIPSLDSWELRYKEKRYVFPRADVIELPLDNSTAERLAEYVGNELHATLAQQYDIARVHSLTVGVEEAPMQMAYYQMAI